MKNTLLFLAALLFAASSFAQREDRPGWVNNPPKAGNKTYMYVVERAVGATQNEARNNALARVYQSTMMRIGATVSWDEINGSIQGGADWGTMSIKYNIPVNKVCEFSEKIRDGWLVSVLCQVAKSGAQYPDWDEFTGCTDTKEYSNGTALLKSAIIPGLGQMGKRHVGSGIFTLLGEMTCIGGAVVTNRIAQDKLAVIKKTDVGLTDYLNAKNSYNTLRYANIACWSAATALYVWNLYRACSIKPKYKKDKTMLSFNPTLLMDNQQPVAGIGLTLNF